MNKPLLGLFILSGAVVLLFVLALVAGYVIGPLAPDHASFAYTGRFDGSPESLWRRLAFPEQRSEVRVRADGAKYQAEEGDTTGSLFLLYEPPSRKISHNAWPNAELWSVVTLKRVQGGTIVRVEESALLRGGWHRLLFPPKMKQWAEKELRDYGRLAGQKDLQIAADHSPPLAFTLHPPPPGDPGLKPQPEEAAGAASAGPDSSPAASTVAGRTAAANGRSAPEPKTSSESLPRFGQLVHVETLPEARVKVPPVYPDVARYSNVEGTVMVQALIGRDGLVKDARVVKSIPPLDEAAMTAVKQWEFKPATSRGAPVAVWVAIPVKFTLH